MLEDLEEEVIEYESVREFMMAIKKEFGGRDEESVKVVELKKVGAGRKDNGEVCARVEEGSSGKWI